MSFYLAIQHLLMLTAVGLPAQGWWLPALVLLILGLAATIDAYTASIPDELIFGGLVAVVGMQGYYVSWPFAAIHLAWALTAMFAIWLINEIWYRFFRHDALGMGDAKWTMLAVAAFGTVPAFAAWGVGACLGLVWIAVVRLFDYRVTRVYFAPFLFVGLVIGLYVLRIRLALA